MRTRLPKLIWRYLSVDLWRLGLLCALVIVAVACFAITVKPLAEGRLSPVEALWFMSLAIVPMLQYALPLAGGFAATMVYHRFAADNELTACYAGGISHRRVLGPGLILGVVLAAVLGVVVDQAIPRLLRNMEQLIAGDLTRIIAGAIDKGEAVRLPASNRYLYADKLLPQEADGSGATQQFWLLGLLVVELDKDGKVVFEASAQRAYVRLFQEGGGRDADTGEVMPGTTRVVMDLKGAVGGQLSKAEVDNATYTYTVPSRFIDDPKYMTWMELEAQKARPDLVVSVDSRRRGLALRLAERMTADLLRKDLGTRGTVSLKDAGGRSVVVKCSGVAGVGEDKGVALLPLRESGVVEIATVLEDGRVRTHRARRAYLAQALTIEAGTSVLSLRMEEVSISGPGSRELDPEAPRMPAPEGEAAGARMAYTIQNLVPTADPLPDLLAMGSIDLERQARRRLETDASQGRGEDKPLMRDVQRLTQERDGSVREIISKQHERIATCLACLVSVLCGGVMALRLKESLPLPVYLWSFLPACAATMTINGGQKLMSDNGWIGAILLYGGVAALAVFTWWEYRILARH